MYKNLSVCTICNSQDRTGEVSQCNRPLWLLYNSGSMQVLCPGPAALELRGEIETITMSLHFWALLLGALLCMRLVLTLGCTLLLEK